MAQGDELIQAFRELLERNIEQARTAYSLYLDTVADAMRAWSNSPTLDSRFKHVQELAIRFAKENGESAFALGKDLAAAKDLPHRNATESARPSADGDLCSSSTGVRASHGCGSAELCTSEALIGN